MAYTEEAIARVIIDGKQAEKELQTLVSRANELKTQIRSLKKEGSNTESVQKELKETQGAIRQMRQSLVDTNQVLSHLNTSSPKELRSTLKKLKGELDSGRIQRGSQAWKDYTEAIRRVKKELHDVNEELSSMSGKGSLFDRFNSALLRYGPMLGSITMGMSKVTGVLKRASEEYAHLTDVYAEVRKYTGITEEEVLRLNQSFAEMNTRTSREELNRLAADAGKLGITGRENILSFVEAADVIRVALGSDLGDDAVKNIGKISDLFSQGSGDLKTNMLASASAINTLGQSSTASEPYILSFTARLAGVGVQAGMIQTDIMGLASALDQDMQAVEMSATAIQNTLLDMFQEPSKYAQVMGVSVSDFTRLLKEDANSAFLSFLDSLQKLGGMDQMAPVLDSLGLSGARVSGVLSDLANNTDKIREAQKIANEAYISGNSVLQEFALNNETEQAKLEKAQKKFKEIIYELGERSMPLLRNTVRLGSLIPKSLLLLLDTFHRYKVTIISVSVAIAAHAVATNASLIADKAKIFWNNAVVASFSRLRAALLKNPYTAITVAVLALTAALADYIRRNKDTLSLQEKIQKLKEDATRDTQNEITQIRILASVVQDENSSYQAKKRAIEQLRDLLPDYRAELTKDGKVIGHNTALVNEYCHSLITMAQVRALSDRAGELSNRKEANDRKITAKERELSSDRKPGFSDYFLSSLTGGSGAFGSKSPEELRRSGVQGEIEKLRRDNQNLEKEISALQREVSRLLGSSSLRPPSPKVSTSSPGSSKGSSLAPDTIKKQDEEIALDLKRWEEERILAKQHYLLGLSDKVEYESRLRDIELFAHQDRIAQLSAAHQDITKETEELYEMLISRKSIFEKDLEVILPTPSYLAEDNPDEVEELTARETYLIVSKANEDKYRLGLIDHATFLTKKTALDEAYYSRLKSLASQSAQELGDISRSSSALVQSLVDLEEKKIENKYAYRLQAAQGNKDREAQIEKEMEREKKSSRKKYADLEFVVTLAEISSRTALGVMDVWSKFGSNPFLAMALSAIVTGTGAVQAGVANEQREKVKNLWTGGYTGDGSWDSPRGVVHAGEFVANRFSVQNPTMKKVFDLVDFAQKNHIAGSITPESIAEAIGYEAKSKVAMVSFLADTPSHDKELKDLLYLLYLQLKRGTLAKASLSGEGGLLSSLENITTSHTATRR